MFVSRFERGVAWISRGWRGLLLRLNLTDLHCVADPLLQAFGMNARLPKWILGLTLVATSLVTARGAAAMKEPEIEGKWLRPSVSFPAEPRWGHPEGIQVGLHPLPGPRGLIRLYAPYLGHPPERRLNYLAVEPIPAGKKGRGLSELEESALDNAQGKRIWSADSPDDPAPKLGTEPARGVIETVDGVERLTVYLCVERFKNGADVYVRVTFREDRPHEVCFATFHRPTSVALDYCVLTATMGNFARLRELHLADRVVHSKDLWPNFRDTDFTPHHRFPLGELRRNLQGDAIVWATPDEADPHAAAYDERVKDHWKYFGKRARQIWRVEHPSPKLEVLVNGRAAYWGNKAPIPGGISFENFELLEPFHQGREFYFAIEPMD